MQRICRLEPEEDSIIETYRRYRKDPIFCFPSVPGGINSTRASILGDKIDWTLWDLKKYYSDQREECLLLPAYRRSKTSQWQDAMGSFENIVEWFCIKGIFTDDNRNVYDLENGGILSGGPNRLSKEWSQEYYQCVKDKIDE